MYNYKGVFLSDNGVLNFATVLR